MKFQERKDNRKLKRISLSVVAVIIIIAIITGVIIAINKAKENYTVEEISSEDINYYKNDYNDTHSTLKVPSNELNAWKVASNNTVNLVYTSGSYSETLKGSITLSTGQLLKANIGIYVLSLLIIVLIVVLIIVIIKLMMNSKRRKKNRRRYSRY